jgi:AAA15 family ATPase/GTPase
MNLINSIEIANFRCFRRLPRVSFSKATFLIGPNNSGKTAILSALDCFFNTASYRSEFLNKTEYASKGTGYNRSSITLEFDLQAISSKTIRQRMISNFGKTLRISKSFTFREISKTIDVKYTINNVKRTLDALEPDIQKLIRAVSISYILPQEGEELLRKAQAKLRDRLLQNWGRYKTLARGLNQLQKKWNDVRKKANHYLSSLLTANLQSIWKDCNTTVDLPERIQDIIAISKINFRGSPSMPEINLSFQGTGAQSTILYQTHFLLDSDRTLHRGQYYPIWLLEEPESFLHADIALKLGDLLTSEDWLNNIQMVISTHSPLILAGSKRNEERISWILLDESYSVRKTKSVNQWDNNEIKQIGQAMGDINFDIYFMAAGKEDAIYLEDTRDITIQSFVKSTGIKVRKGLSGSSEIKKHIEVLLNIEGLLRSKCFFLLDNDKGKREFEIYLKPTCRIQEESGFSLYKICDHLFIILMPPDCCLEDLYQEFDGTLETCCDKLFQQNFRAAENVPGELSGAHEKIRHWKVKPTNREEAKKAIKNFQDVKDIFWKKVANEDLRITSVYAAILNILTS